jgi:DNA-binding transcriptional LysR family regulator
MYGISFYLCFAAGHASGTRAGSHRFYAPPNTLILDELCPFGIMSPVIELRHLRYFAAVAEALSFNKAAAKLRIAQPALSRQVQSLEDEIGVDLFKRSPRGVVLTAEGNLLLEEARKLMTHAEETVEKVRALARGEFGELHIGYAPSPAIEVLPPALAAFQKTTPRVKLVLHDLSSPEIAAGLRAGTLDLGVMMRPTEENAVGLEYELLKSYPCCALIPARHPFAKLKQVPLECLADEPLVSLNKTEYSEYHRLLLSIFATVGRKPRIVAECDSGNSMITAVQSGRGIALQASVYRQIIGKRLQLRPLTPKNLPTMDIVVSRATTGDFTPAAQKVFHHLRSFSRPNQVK